MKSHEPEEHPLLHLLLNERLPLLGLDVETYGPYIVALFPLSTATSNTSLIQDVDNTNNNGEDELVLDGWDEIQELLQASSDNEALTEDTSVWIQLKNDLIVTWRKYRTEQQEKQKLKLLEREQNLQKTLELERNIAIQNSITTSKTNDTNGTTTSSLQDDAAKRALLNRFAYEDDSNNDNLVEDGDSSTVETSENLNKNAGKGNNASSSTTATTTTTTVTKRDEQQKTKQHNQQKIDAKEERRKRAAKGERRR